MITAPIDSSDSIIEIIKGVYNIEIIREGIVAMFVRMKKRASTYYISRAYRASPHSLQQVPEV